jgi:hypothetical protein
MSMELLEEKNKRKTFALIVRGDPDDFQWLVEQARIAELYVVFTKSSFQKLLVKEVPW